MKKRRALKFVLDYKYVSGEGLDAIYSRISDGALIADCYNICNQTNCEFIKMKSPWCDERVLIIKGTKQDFMNFVQKFTYENSKYIDKVKF